MYSIMILRINIKIGKLVGIKIGKLVGIKIGKY